MPENAVLVEGDAPLAGEIGLDAGPCGDAVVQTDQAGNPALERLHAPWKRVAQPRHDLEQREIDMGQPAAGEPGSINTVSFGAPSHSRFYKVSFEGAEGQTWRVGGFALYRQGRKIPVGGP